MTPRASLGPFEGRLLQMLLVLVAALFVGIMACAWYASGRARPMLLELSSGRPAADQARLR